MPTRPNLVVFLPDQHAVTALGCYGNDRIETPHIDRLAGEGVRFENAYCTQPVCTPSRSAIMTGQYPHATGLTENNTPLPPDARCLPELGEFEGYATAYMGKWDLGDEVFAQHGFDRWVSIEDGYRDQYTRGPESARSSYHDFLVENGFEPDSDDGTFSRSFAAGLDEEYTKTAFIADEAVEFVEAHRDQPFVLFVAPLPPHSPYTGPRDDQYDPGDVSLPPNVAGEAVAGHSLKHRLAREATFEPSEEAGWRELISRYWGLASLVDSHVGRVLDALDDAGVADRTVTAYTSDHGDMMGHNATTGKNVLFDAAARVPLVLRGPEIDGGRVVEHPVSQIDLVPTLLDALGQAVPDHCHGHSLLPFLAGETDEPAEPLVFVEDNGPDGNAIDRRKDEWPDRGSRPQPERRLVAATDADEADIRRAYLEPVRTVVTPDGLKLNCYGGGERELYDLGRDPAEMENLAGNPEYAERVEELTGAVHDWQVRTRDPVYLP